MRVRNPPLAPAAIQGSGPGEYFFQKKNARGQKREPAPRKLFGDPRHFDRLVRFSPAPHPHLHCVLGYKGEAVAPPREIKDRIMAMYLQLLREDSPPTRFTCLAWTTGTTTMLPCSAIWSHRIGRVSSRIITSTTGSLPPISSGSLTGATGSMRLKIRRTPGSYRSPAAGLASRRFNFSLELRAEIAGPSRGGWLQNHAAFVHHLEQIKGWKTELMPVSNGEESFDEDSDDHGLTNRVWMKITTPDDLVVPIKGPVCHPHFSMEGHKKKQEQKTRRYQDFLRDASGVWQRFCDGYRKRREYNRKRYPLHCEPDGTDLILGFEDLDPTCHPAIPSPPSPYID